MEKSEIMFSNEHHGSESFMYKLQGSVSVNVTWLHVLSTYTKLCIRNIYRNKI